MEKGSQIITIFCSIITVVAAFSLAFLVGLPGQGSRQWSSHNEKQYNDERCTKMVSLFGLELGENEGHSIKKDRQVELCQQIVSAYAAEDSARFAKWQFALGIVALFLTAMAAIAAMLAAKFTWHQSETSKKSLLVENRAWLLLQCEGREQDGAVLFERWSDRFILRIAIHVANIGRTPAYNVRILPRVHLSTNGSGIAEFIASLIREMGSAGPNTDTILPNEDVDWKNFAVMIHQKRIDEVTAILPSGRGLVAILAVVASYKIVGDEASHETVRCFMLSLDINAPVGAKGTTFLTRVGIDEITN